MTMTPAPISMRERLRTDYGWTPRQREVLDLITRGRSNTEIAEELGISLAGAKWHVSEILSKLQAESREEAAEYWRRYNGLAPRFERVFRGVMGAGALKWAGAAFAASLAIGAVVLFVGLLWEGGGPDTESATDDEPPQAAAPTETPDDPADDIPCPVDQSICDFALEVELLLRVRDYTATAASNPEIESAIREQAETWVPNGEPRLVSIGCPYGAVSDSCDPAFSLVFTTLAPTDEWRGDSGILLLQYERTAAGNVLRLGTNISEEATRRVALVGGPAGQPCNLSGIAPGQTEETCSRSMFYPYASGELFVRSAPPSADAFVLAGEEPPPPGTVMYLVTGCWGCEGYDTGLVRVQTDQTGTISVEELPSPPLGQNERVSSYQGTADASLLLGSTCIGEGGTCAVIGYTGADALGSRLLASRDGGFTWEEMARYEERASVTITASGRVLVFLYRPGHSPEAAGEYSWELLGPRETLTPPPGSSPSAWPLVLADGRVGWLEQALGRVYASDGSLMFQPELTARDMLGSIQPLPDGRWLVSWVSATTPLTPSGAPNKSYFGVFEPDGAMVWAREAPSVAGLRLTQVLGASALGGIDAQSANWYGQQPALIDLEDGIIRPLAGPFGTPPLGGRNTFLAFVQGPFARVTTGGDCLNVREEATTGAESLGCFVDGVLLRDLGESREADGITWLRVATPDGREGWASAEFLER